MSWGCRLNSIGHDFGLQLLKNKTVKQRQNDHSTRGDLEQEFAENNCI